MAGVVSLYLKDSTLRALDAEVARRAQLDREKGLSGRSVTSRSSLISEILEKHLEGPSLSRDRITYCVVSLAKEYGAKEVSLFGSWARGEQTESSDIDLLVEKGSMRGLQVLDFQARLEKELGRPVDVVTTASCSQRFLSRIEQEKVTIYEAS